MSRLSLHLAFGLLVTPFFGHAAEIHSPNGKIVVDFHLTDDGQPRYSVKTGSQQVIKESDLGLIRDDADFSKGLKLTGTDEGKVTDSYEILTAKKKNISYQANSTVFSLANAEGKKLLIKFQVSDDGVGFRYAFPEKSTTLHKLSEERTSFHFSTETRAWLQPMSVAKTGWAETNPSYEEYYERDIPVGTPSKLAGWVYPALFRTGDTWVLLSEAALSRHYCATRLRAESPDGEYRIGFPDPREVIPGGASAPESTLPWITPWRVIVIGSLKVICESTLGIDLADKPAANAKAAEPGKASWSWPLLGDSKTIYEVQKDFIDYAARMGWRYTLIDAQWDQQIGDTKIRDLTSYAASKNVKVLVWYNSAGPWNSTFQTPRSKLLTAENRKKEFERLKKLGVSGVKIDFFGGDGQSMIAYQQDILEETAAYGLNVNFHGTTLPRGWERTYPHFMTAEAIRGLEFITFEQANADQEPIHAAMIPFTRNVFDPMDFTPMVLDKINDKVKRRTTSAFELALPVLFTSGITHYGEIPSGIAKTPDYVQDYIKSIPSVWEDSRFIDGHPGDYVVMARYAKGTWFVSGINGSNSEQKLSLNLAELKAKSGLLITDGDAGNCSFSKKAVQLDADGMYEVTLPSHAGFVMTLK